MDVPEGRCRTVCGPTRVMPGWMGECALHIAEVEQTCYIIYIPEHTTLLLKNNILYNISISTNSFQNVHRVSLQHLFSLQ